LPFCAGRVLIHDRPSVTPACHRAIFLSDIHLGTRGCQAELLLDFLKRNESETSTLSATLSTAGG
jgi:hypothetical protein